MSKCPICLRNNDGTPLQKAKEFIASHGLVSEYVNPGGRELLFRNGKRVQLFDCCPWCDYDVLLLELGEQM